MSTDQSSTPAMAPDVCYRCGALADSHVDTCSRCGWRHATGEGAIALRWLAFLPAAIGAAVGGFVLLRFAFSLIPDNNTVLGVRLVLFVCWGFMGHFFVVIGSRVAPKRRAAIPWTLACIFSALAVLGVYLVLTSASIGLQGADRWQLIWMGVTGIIAALVTAGRRGFER